MLGFGLGLNKWRRVGGGYVGLLDLFPNAAAAYSLRKLRAAYSGAAVRVRRSSDNTEQDIGFDANGDLDTTALLAFVGTGGTDNGFVTTWYDQSGNGNNATNATASEQPLVVSGGTLVTENGKAAILSAPLATQNLLRATFTLAQPLSIIGVVKTPLDRDQMPISSQNTTLRAYRRFATSDNFLIQAGSNVFAGSQTLAQSLEFAVYNGSSGIFALDGNLLTTANFGTNGLDNLDLFQSNGGLPSYETYLQEVIIFDSNQSANRTAIETNINNFYSIYP